MDDINKGKSCAGVKEIDNISDKVPAKDIKEKNVANAANVAENNQAGKQNTPKNLTR